MYNGRPETKTVAVEMEMRTCKPLRCYIRNLNGFIYHTVVFPEQALWKFDKNTLCIQGIHEGGAHYRVMSHFSGRALLLLVHGQIAGITKGGDSSRTNELETFLV